MSVPVIGNKLRLRGVTKFFTAAKLKKNYKHVEDIDLFIGMLAEPTEATDGIVGKKF